MYLRMKEFIAQFLGILDFSIQEDNFIHFDELLALEKIQDIEKLNEEKKFMKECDDLKERVKKIKDTLNY